MIEDALFWKKVKKMPNGCWEWQGFKEEKYLVIPPHNDKGEKNGNAVLTEKDIIEIKERIKEGSNNKEIAAEYGTTHSNISCIRCGKSWKHI